MDNKQFFDIEKVINTLMKKRHAFVSEADFQLEFAWETKKKYPKFKVRLEYTPRIQIVHAYRYIADNRKGMDSY